MYVARAPPTANASSAPPLLRTIGSGKGTTFSRAAQVVVSRALPRRRRYGTGHKQLGNELGRFVFDKRRRPHRPNTKGGFAAALQSHPKQSA